MRSKIILWVAVIVVMGLLVGCAAAPAGTATVAPSSRGSTPTPGATQAAATTAPGIQAGSSGIRGQALIGPSCPGPSSGSGECGDKPYQASFIVLNANMQPVTEFQTDAQGKFEVTLPPGEYTLRAQRSGRYPVAADVDVTVKKGEYTEVSVHFDSGLR
jgi:hypothetical protein